MAGSAGNKKRFNIVRTRQDNKFFNPEFLSRSLRTQSHYAFTTGQSVSSGQFLRGHLCADKQIKCSRRDQARVETTRQWREREARVVSVGYSLVRLFMHLGVIFITRVGSSSSSSARAIIVHVRFTYGPLDRSRQDPTFVTSDCACDPKGQP